MVTCELTMRATLGFTLLYLLARGSAFTASSPSVSRPSRLLLQSSDVNESISLASRRKALQHAVVAGFLTAGISLSHTPQARAEEENMYAPKFVQEYSDFTDSGKGWSYRDVSVGKGASASQGDRVVFDFSGYTIGYFGRPFQAKGGPQGGAFDKDVDYLRTVLGSGKMVPGLESALEGMQAGGVRQVVIPYGNLSYPADDPTHEVVGPKPTTFSGMRALNFVLENPRVDRTLLFNVKVIRVDKPDGKGAFIRG